MIQIIDQYDKPTFENLYTIFNFDQKVIKDPRINIQLSGIKKPVLPPQLYTAYWTIFRRIEALLSLTFLADVTGVGKIIKILLVIVLTNIFLQPRPEYNTAEKLNVEVRENFSLIMYLPAIVIYWV